MAAARNQVRRLGEHGTATSQYVKSYKVCKRLIIRIIAKGIAKGDSAYLITIKNKSLCATLLFLISSRSLLFLE